MFLRGGIILISLILLGYWKVDLVTSYYEMIRKYELRW